MPAQTAWCEIPRVRLRSCNGARGSVAGLSEETAIPVQQGRKPDSHAELMPSSE
jgi:hypothetical protein